MIRRLLVGLTLWTVPITGIGAGPSPARTLSLRLRFVPGRTLVYRIDTASEVLRDGQRKPVHSTVTYTLHRETLSVSPGEATLRYRFDRIARNVTGSSSDVDFDSRAPVAVDEPEAFATLRKVVGKSFLVTMDQRGQVLDVRGTKELAALAPAADSTVKQRLAEVVGENQLRGLLRAQFAWMPKAPVTLGKRWTRRETVPLGFVSLVRTNTLKVRGVSGSRVDIDSSIGITGQASEGVVAGAIRLTGAVSAQDEAGAATLRFDTRSGLIESVSSEVRFALRIDETSIKNPKRKTSHTQRLRAGVRLRLLSVDNRPTRLAN